tara:strand:+ start:68 stop:283 length:216 start_codon:yes stop_codon:yes gene_type:complete
VEDDVKNLETISKEIFGNSWIVPLAEYVGVTRQAVYLWLAKKRRIPQVVMVCLQQRQKLDKIPDSWLKSVQ